jgi:hypothetical protein
VGPLLNCISDHSGFFYFLLAGGRAANSEVEKTFSIASFRMSQVES